MKRETRTRETAEQKAKRLKEQFLSYYGLDREDAALRILRDDVNALLRAEREAAAERAMAATDGSYDPVLWRSRLRAAILGKRKP